MIRAERFRQAMLEKGISQGSLAREIGVTPAAIQQIANGKTQQPRAIAQLARALEVSTAWLEGVTDDPTPDAFLFPTADVLAEQLGLVRIREVEIGYALGSGTVIPDHVDSAFRVFDSNWLAEITRSAADMLFIARGIGDSMQSTIMDNDTLLVDRGQRRMDQQDRIWAVAYGELGMVKRIRRLPNGKYLVISDNPAIENFEAEADELHFIGRIVWIGRRA